MYTSVDININTVFFVLFVIFIAAQTTLLTLELYRIKEVNKQTVKGKVST